MYHPDPLTNDIILTIINDGNGSQCGMTYEQRKRAAARGDLHAFRYACWQYKARARQLDTAAQFLLDYYVNHNKECNEHEEAKASQA